jgi:hypothetical protein
MAKRGSLKFCIHAICSMWDSGHQGFLSVVCNPRGKYYTVMTDTDLDNKYNDQGEQSQRLVLRLTKKELHSILLTDQLTLFPKDSNGNTPPPVQAGQLDSDNSAD